MLLRKLNIIHEKCSSIPSYILIRKSRHKPLDQLSHFNNFCCTLHFSIFFCYICYCLFYSLFFSYCFCCGHYFIAPTISENLYCILYSIAVCYFRLSWNHFSSSSIFNIKFLMGYQQFLLKLYQVQQPLLLASFLTVPCHCCLFLIFQRQLIKFPLMSLELFPVFNVIYLLCLKVVSAVASSAVIAAFQH